MINSTWLLETEKYLYLMKGGTNKYLSRLTKKGPTNFALPESWFHRIDAPRSMVRDLVAGEILPFKTEPVIPAVQPGRVDNGLVDKAIFSMRLGGSEHRDGKINFFNKEGKSLGAFVATTGIAPYQSGAHFGTPARGPLPPVVEWEISTEAYWCPELAGVEGYWFDLIPWTVDVGGTIRSAFGLHQDANVVGSSGCIVVADLSSFENKVVPMLKEAAKAGVQSIPLKLVYS